MFKSRTLFVVGAGASSEVGLPLGGDLAATIAKKMDIRYEHYSKPTGGGDFALWNHIRAAKPDQIAALQQAAWLIRDGIRFAPSIDDFLDQHRSNQFANLYGKAAIVKAILEMEQNSSLHFDPFKSPAARFDIEKFANTWFVKFIHMLGRGIPKENVREIFDNASFIVFNYDRCIEFFLLHALQKLYGIAEGDASAIVDDLSIIHPYGHVGSIRDVPFGAGNVNYLQLASGIKTYTEQIGAADVIGAVAAEMARAQSVVFLGFAYHSQNMSILKPKEQQPPKFVYGTAFKMSDSDVGVVFDQIADFFSPQHIGQRAERIKIENKHKSADLFDYYAKSLAG